MTSIDAAAGADVAVEDRSFFGHPKGLAVLFAAEMWERFSYYGMRALLVLYLTQHFLFSDERAQGLYAAYAALVYLMPVAGGYIADKFLGSRKAVTIGALFLVLGHFGMAFEGSGSTETLIAQDGTRYEILAEGRGENRTLSVKTDDGRSPLNFSSEGAQIGEGANAVKMAAGSYRTEIEREDVFVGVLFLSLSLIIVGVGFLKANIATIVGALYEQGDRRRDGGFTIFYMGINIGSVSAIFLCGWLGLTYGWKYGFGLAGIGMLAGLLTFLAGQKWLYGRADPPHPERLKKPVFGPINWEAVFWIGGLLAIFPTYWLVQREVLVSGALRVLAPVLIAFMVGFSVLRLKGVERTRMIVALVLTMFGVTFWALFEQAASSLTLYASRNTDLGFFTNEASAFGFVTIAALTGAGYCFLMMRGSARLVGLAIVGISAASGYGFAYAQMHKAVVLSLLLMASGLLAQLAQASLTGAGRTIIFSFAGVFALGAVALAVLVDGDAITNARMASAQAQLFNPGFIVLLAPVFAGLWSWLAEKGRDLSVPVKFALGLAQVGFGFWLIVYGASNFANEDFKVPLIWLAGAYLLHTTGEICLSPVGLSMITKLSVARLVGLMMGIWYLSISLGQVVAGILAGLTASETVGGVVIDPAAQLATYIDVFFTVGALGVGAGAIVLLLSPWLKKGMAGRV